MSNVSGQTTHLRHRGIGAGEVQDNFLSDCDEHYVAPQIVARFENPFGFSIFLAFDGWKLKRVRIPISSTELQHTDTPKDSKRTYAKCKDTSAVQRTAWTYSKKEQQNNGTTEPRTYTHGTTFRAFRSHFKVQCSVCSIYTEY